MLESIKLAWAFLAGQHEWLPFIAVTLLVYGLFYAWRKISPRSWLWLEARLPWFGEITKGEELAQNIAMGLPSVLLGALVSGLASGVDLKVTLLGALAGAFAPLVHHTRKAAPFDPYRGAIGKLRPPVLPVLYLFALAVMASVQPSIVGCSPATRQTASANMVEKATALAFNGAVVALLLLDDQEARYLDSLERPTELQLAQAQLRVNSLTRARDALAIVRRALSGELGDLALAGRKVRPRAAGARPAARGPALGSSAQAGARAGRECWLQPAADPEPGRMMRRALDAAITAGAAVVIVASVLLPWAWGEARKAKR